MRAAFLLLLLIPIKAWSQACTGATITSGVAGNIYNCTTLTITPGTYNFPANADYVRVIVTGDVNIAAGAVLNLSGADGVSDTTEAQPGGVGGPGASAGGGNNSGPEDAADTPNGGSQGVSDPNCGGGGGGGGFASNAEAGGDCATALGGAAGTFYDITILFRGGFGGAAGGLGDFGFPLSTATGGGGGGSIWISAGGNITNNGNIDVRGGAGGTGIVKSGGGGGGSGGAIRLEATGNIINNGVFFFSGGNGGAGNGPGGSGGDGANGLYEMSDADNVIEGIGTGAIGNGSGTSETFHSSISCGSVEMKDERHLFFQVILGFALMLLISKILGRFRRSV
jgi:hypothetical protein